MGTQFVDGKIQVIFAEEYERPNFQAMINRMWEIKQKCGHISNIYVDASSPEIIQALKREFHEPFNQQYINDQIAIVRNTTYISKIECLLYQFPFQ